MDAIVRKLLEWGYGKAAATTALRHGLTALGAAAATALTEAGVAPDSTAGLTAWLAGAAPIIVSVVWSWLAHKYGVQVAQVALVSDSAETASVADVQAKIAAGRPI